MLRILHRLNSQVFAKTRAFEHGKSENAVKTVKRLFKKCRDSGESEFKALLDWRNTPPAGVGTSPAQRLMGRHCKTFPPVAGTLLLQRHSTKSETRGLLGMKRRQQYYANQHTKPLAPIESGDTIRMRLPGKKR